MSIEFVMLSSYLIFCCPLLLLPSIFSRIRVFISLSLCLSLSLYIYIYIYMVYISPWHRVIYHHGIATQALFLQEVQKQAAGSPRLVRLFNDGALPGLFSFLFAIFSMLESALMHTFPGLGYGCSTCCPTSARASRKQVGTEPDSIRQKLSQKPSAYQSLTETVSLPPRR